MSYLSIRYRIHLTVFAGLMLVCASGCSTLKAPSTPGETARKSEFGYIPLDPLPVGTKPVNPKPEEILRALPDETMRMAIGSVSGDGKITYGPASVGYSGNSYVVVVDYIKYNTKSLGLIKDPTQGPKLAGPNSLPETTVPVYVGVGLRLTASLTVNEGNVNLGNLIAIGVAASAKKVSGTLVIQTLGISGEGVSSAIPIPTDINTTTIQNALMSLGTIKGKIYAPTTSISPRVVGIYKNFGDSFGTVNGVIGLLLSNPVTLDTTPGTANPL